jgi:ABC-type transport system substrate-binding protein
MSRSRSCSRALAIARPTPEHAPITRPLPATGPYEIATYSQTRLVRLVRNPYFLQWSRAAQPDGYPDQIVWRVGASTSTAITMIEQGRADYTLDGPPPDRLPEVQTRFASQLHTNPNDVTIQLVLNTTVAPFNDLRARRALSYGSTEASSPGSWASRLRRPVSCSRLTSRATSRTVHTRSTPIARGCGARSTSPRPSG